jgi:hypothetical protein
VIQDNLDEFIVHPIYTVAGVLPDRAAVDQVVPAVETADVVQILHGEEGLRILDRRGEGHGLFARIHRLLQEWTFYETILASYTESLAHGEFLILIPAEPEHREAIGRLIADHGGHAVYWFGMDTVESMTA